MTRITYGMISDNVQIGIQSNAGKLNTLMTQLATGKALNQLVTDVTTVKVREDQYISMSGNFASFCFCLCYGRNDCSIKL